MIDWCLVGVVSPCMLAFCLAGVCQVMMCILYLLGGSMYLMSGPMPYVAIFLSIVWYCTPPLASSGFPLCVMDNQLHQYKILS
jgi:hypothetical protein